MRAADRDEVLELPEAACARRDLHDTQEPRAGREHAFVAIVELKIDSAMSMSVELTLASGIDAGEPTP